MSDYQDIIYTVADRIATISFNRPQVHNAMSMRLRVETVDALKRAEADDSVSVVVIQGEGNPVYPATCLIAGIFIVPRSQGGSGWIRKSSWNSGFTNYYSWHNADYHATLDSTTRRLSCGLYSFRSLYRQGKGSQHP